jgi:hypothetical protein
MASAGNRGTGARQLFVRFDYETLQSDAAAPIDEFYSNFAKQAYVEANIDTIRRLALEQIVER